MGLLVALLLLLAWAGWHAVRGARDLQAAADELGTLRADLSGGEVLPGLRAAAGRTATGRAHLENPVLRALALVPVAGRPLETATGLAAAADTAVREALLPLAAAAGDQPAERLTSGPGAINLAFLAGLTAPTAEAVTQLARADGLVAGTPASTGVGELDRARSDFAADLTELRGVLDEVARGLDVAPHLLGQGTTRRYLVMSQSPSEARGTGGLLGGYSLLEVTDGAFEIVRSDRLSALVTPNEPVVDLGPEFAAHYGGNGATSGWSNSNLSPHFPYAGRIWQELWSRQYAEELDGTLVLDPIALSYLMAATGPVTLPEGTEVTAANVVDLTLRDVYARSDQNAVRDAFLQQVSVGVAEAVTTRDIGGRALFDAFSRAADERRLLLWSTDERVQQRLADQSISGRLPAEQRAVGAVVSDAIGSKLDYYLDRDVRFTAGCDGSVSELALTLTNGAPASGLPDYVTPEFLRGGEPAGTNRLLTTLFLPPGSVVAGVTVDGVDSAYTQGTELGLVWLDLLVTLRPGEAKQVTATFAEPSDARGEVVEIVQPLVRPQTSTVTTC